MPIQKGMWSAQSVAQGKALRNAWTPDVVDLVSLPPGQNDIWRTIKAMVKIEITQSGQAELDKLGFKVKESVNDMLSFVPSTDLMNLSHIIVTDKPNQWTKHLEGAAGAYYQKQKNTAAYIEIYISRLFAHVKSVESMRLISPLQNVGLAQILFHEIGHHVEKIRSHGITKNTREGFAGNYGNKMLANYLAANAEIINECFMNLEKVADEKGLSRNVLSKMKTGWKAQFEDLCNWGGTRFT